MSRSATDKRRHPRSLVDCLVQLHPLVPSCDDANQLRRYCIAQDISAGGMRIWADRYFSVNTQVRLTFDCDRVGIHRPISCIVTVVWADPSPVEDRWQLSVQFGDDTDSRRVADALSHGCLWCQRLCPDIAVDERASS